MSHYTATGATDAILPGLRLRRGRLLATTAVSALLLLAPGIEAQTNITTAPAPRTEETNANELRTYLQLQEQLHATQLAIERSRKETDENAAQSARMLAARLESIEQSLAAQRARELEAMQESNRVMLIVAGCFATVGFLAMLLMAYFQWRTINRLAEIAAALPSAGLALPAGRPVQALGSGDRPLVSAGPPEIANQSLLETVARLEQRILELEHTSHPPLARENPVITQADSGAPSNGEPSNGAPAHAGDAPMHPSGRIATLLGKGQSLLNLDKPEEAMECFDEVLAIEPGHPEALVKKGAAFERQRKLNEAIECYDRAIAADGSLTIAYLYKGGVFNRMERFTEALECYEKALHTQEKRRG